MSEWVGDLRIDIENGAVENIESVYQAAAEALGTFLGNNNSKFTSWEWFAVEYNDVNSSRAANFEAWWGANDGADLGYVLGGALSEYLANSGWSASSAVFARPTSLY